MKHMKTLALIGASAAGVLTLGASALYAAQLPTTKADRMSGLVNALAQKFNVSAADVQKVFDEQHELMLKDMEAKRAEHLKTRLDQAVKDGKITQAQEDLILAKQKELQTTFESLQGKTEAEKRDAMKAQMEALKKWAADNKIPEQFVMPFHGMGKGKFGHGFRMGVKAGRAFEGKFIPHGPAQQR